MLSRMTDSLGGTTLLGEVGFEGLLFRATESKLSNKWPSKL